VPASLVARVVLALRQGMIGARELLRHVLLTVRGSDPRLELSTSSLSVRSTVHLNDFASKHAAIAEGIGYGWLPDARIERELAAGTLRRIRWTRSSRHVFRPRLYHRGALGPSARRLVEALAG
jgi:DNA-binding transcriptional LysR family regulator